MYLETLIMYGLVVITVLLDRTANKNMISYKRTQQRRSILKWGVSRFLYYSTLLYAAYYGYLITKYYINL